MKAQLWSLDFTGSILIFVISVVIMFFAFNLSVSQIAEQTELTNIEDAALEVTDALIRTGGLPADWNIGNVEVIGLAERENVINKSKIFNFISLNYNTSKTLLGIANYDYYFEIIHLNNSVIRIDGTNLTGGENYTSAKTLIPVERYILFETQPAKLKFILFRD